MQFVITSYGDPFIGVACDHPECGGWLPMYYADDNSPIKLDTLVNEVVKHIRQRHHTEWDTVKQVGGMDALSNLLLMQDVPFSHELVSTVIWNRR